METRGQSGRDETVWPPPPVRENAAPPQLRPLTKMEVFWQIFGRMAGMGLTRGALCGAGFGVFFYVVGALYGVFIGGIAGLLLGCVTGLVLAFGTCQRFYPLEDAAKFRRFACGVSAALAFLPGLVAVVASLRSTDTAPFWMLVVFLPSLIAVVAAWTAGGRIADWYEDETRKRREG